MWNNIGREAYSETWFEEGFWLSRKSRKLCILIGQFIETLEEIRDFSVHKTFLSTASENAAASGEQECMYVGSVQTLLFVDLLEPLGSFIYGVWWTRYAFFAIICRFIETLGLLYLWGTVNMMLCHTHYALLAIICGFTGTLGFLYCMGYGEYDPMPFLLCFTWYYLWIYWNPWIPVSIWSTVNMMLHICHTPYALLGFYKPLCTMLWIYANTPTV